MPDTSVSPTSSVDISDTTSPTNQPTTGAFAQGVSNPPDDPILANNDDSSGLAPQSGPAQNTPQPGTRQGQPQQGPQGPQGSQSPQTQQPKLSAKIPNQPVQGAPAADMSQHPSVQKAGVLHTIAQTLAGGPRYKESIDVNTGQMVRTPVPLSKSDIGMAIAMEAISGALSGLSVRPGPGNLGRAAGAGFEQEQAQQKQAQQTQDQQANADYARHAQVLETNLRLHQNAVTAGRANLETNESYVSQFKPLADQIQKNHPEIVKGLVDESDLSKYHVTKDSAIPYSVTKRLDPKTGQQVVDQYGEPQWDVQYLVIDPSFKADDFLSPQDRAEAAKFRLPGFADSNGKPSNLPQSLPMRLSMAMNYKSRIASLRLAENDINNYYGKLNKSVENGNVPMTAPVMGNEVIQTAVDNAANKYGVPVALARAVAMQESGGNPNVVSPKGAQGVMQLMPDTAKMLGITDPHNTMQNIDGGVRYLGQLLKQFNGNTKLALAAYNAGPGKVTKVGDIPNYPETQKYVSAILKSIGMGSQQGPQAGDKETYKPVDLVEAVRQDPTLVDALEKFQPILNATQQNYAKAIGQLGTKDPQAAGKILALYGGTSLVNHYDQQQILAQDAAKKHTEDAELLNRQSQDREAKNAEHAGEEDTAARAIAGDPKDPGSGDMVSMADVFSMRTDQRGRVFQLAKLYNPNFSPKNAELKYQTWEDFATDKGKASQQVKSFNTLFDHIGGALDAVNNLHSTRYGQAINEPINKFKKDYAGDPNLTNLIAAIEPVKSEFMTFLSNNHALTDHDKNVGDDILNWNMSPAQLAGNLNEFAKTAAYRLVETNNQFKRVFGTNAPGLVSGDAVNTIRRMPQIADIIGNMDTGGTFLGSSTGRGTLGQTVNQAIGRQPHVVPGQRQGEIPVMQNGQVVGFTMPGKHGMRPISQQQQQQQQSGQ